MSELSAGLADDRAAGPSRAAVLRVLVFALAVGQFISPVFSALFGGTLTNADRPGEPVITPAGYTFAIWGLIEVLSLAYAIWALWWARREPEVVDRLSGPLAVVFAGFSLWLLADRFEPYFATLAVFVMIIAALAVAVGRALRERDRIRRWPALGRALLWLALGLYLGWSSVAIWLNLTISVVALGAPVTGTLGFVGQLAILAGAAGGAVLVLIWTRGLVPYAAAVVWAFAGAIVGSLGAGAIGLATAAGVGIVVVATTCTALVIRHRRPLA